MGVGHVPPPAPRTAYDYFLFNMTMYLHVLVMCEQQLRAYKEASALWPGARADADTRDAGAARASRPGPALGLGPGLGIQLREPPSRLRAQSADRSRLRATRNEATAAVRSFLK